MDNIWMNKDQFLEKLLMQDYEIPSNIRRLLMTGNIDDIVIALELAKRNLDQGDWIKLQDFMFWEVKSEFDKKIKYLTYQS